MIYQVHLMSPVRSLMSATYPCIPGVMTPERSSQEVGQKCLSQWYLNPLLRSVWDYLYPTYLLLLIFLVETLVKWFLHPAMEEGKGGG